MPMRSLSVLALVGALLYSAPAPARPREAAPARQFDFRESTLANGLRIVSMEDHSTPIAAVQVWYHVGSKNEHPDRQGFAHMFEHMMFRGTENVKPEEHFDLIRGTGGWCNAFTSFDYTAYVNVVPSNQVELAMWLEAERMLYLDVSEEGFETERKVVEEERRMDLNQPYGTLFEQLVPALFHNHPYRWTPIGKIAHLRAAKLAELKSFWDVYYAPNNATLVVVGAISHEEVRALAERYFGWIPRMPEPPRVVVGEPIQTEPRALTIQERLGPVPIAWFAYRGVPKGHPDFVALDILTSILGSGESSRLNQGLVKEQRICQEAYASLYGLEQDGILYIGGELAPGATDLEPLLGALNTEVERLRKEPVSARELQKVKNQYLRTVVTDQLSIYRKAMAIGRSVIENGSADWLNQQIAAIEAVTVEDLQRVARTYLDARGRTVMRVVPNPAAEPAPETEVADIAPLRETFVKEGVPRPAAFPTAPPLHDLLETVPVIPMEEKTLSNGLRVVVVPNREVPFTTALLGLRPGAWAEDPESPGVAAMTLGMLTKGTKKYSAAELAETLAFNALTLDGAAGTDFASVSATALAAKLPLALELLAEVVLRPSFPEDELAILREQTRNALAVAAKDPEHLASRELQARLFGAHPYARLATGDLEDVDKIQRDQLVAWWTTHARPDEAVLYLAGDVTPKEAYRLAEKALGGWQAEGPALEPDLAEIPAAEATHIYIVDVPGAVQSQIRVGALGFTRRHPDWHKAFVFSDIFGGSFNSRLNKVIRVERGLTYGARGGFRGDRFAGRFEASTFTRTETTAETVQAILDVVQSMRAEPVTPEELSSSKANLVGRFPSNLETPQNMVEYAWLIEYSGLPKTYLEDALRTYKETTVEDLTRIAAEHIDMGKAVIVVAGDAATIRESLEKIAPVTVVAPRGESAPGQ